MDAAEIADWYGARPDELEPVMECELCGAEPAVWSGERESWLCEPCERKTSSRACRTCGRGLLDDEQHVCDECVAEVEQAVEWVDPQTVARYRETA